MYACKIYVKQHSPSPTEKMKVDLATFFRGHGYTAEIELFTLVATLVSTLCRGRNVFVCIIRPVKVTT